MVLRPRYGVRACSIRYASFFICFGRYYLATSRELKRLDAVSRSPIFAWFSESLNGLSTIRAFGQQNLFIQNNERRVDRNQICYLPRCACSARIAYLRLADGSLVYL